MEVNGQLREKLHLSGLAYRADRKTSFVLLFATNILLLCLHDTHVLHVKEVREKSEFLSFKLESSSSGCFLPTGNKPVPICHEQNLDVWRRYTDHQQRGTSSIYCFKYAVIVYYFYSVKLYMTVTSTSCTCLNKGVRMQLQAGIL